MTSPAIQSNEKARKAAEAANQRKQSETSTATEATSSVYTTTTIANTLPLSGLFAWLRIFRFADSLMRQGC